MKTGYKYVIDLTHFEEQGKALEGKGAIVFDHRNRKFYTARSNRAHVDVINELVSEWNKICIDGSNNPYEAVTFEAKDFRGDVIYHTDCLMSLHEKHVLVCLDALRDQTERAALVQALTTGAHPVEIFELSLEQIEHMAANAQSVYNDKGDNCMIISQRGYNAMRPDQQRLLNASYKMVVSNVDMIEAVGGGSCRCMLVENWSTTVVSSVSNAKTGLNLKMNVIAACQSEDCSSESSAVGSSIDLDSSTSSFKI